MKIFLTYCFVCLLDDFFSVHGADVKSRQLRRQHDESQQYFHEKINLAMDEHDVSQEIPLEVWKRWLIEDMSMRTQAPITPVSPPTNTPLTPPTNTPVSPPTNTPFFPPLPPPTKAPISIPTRRPTLPLPPLTAAPVSSMPSESPSFDPSSSPSIAPIISPVTLAPQTLSPATLRPVTQAPTRPVGSLLDLIQTVSELSTLSNAIATSDANRNIPPFLSTFLNSSSTSITIFAPVNSGFVALAGIVPGYLSQLFTPEFGLHLNNLLMYHATSGLVPTSEYPITNLNMLSSGSVNTTVSTNSTFSVRSFSTVQARILPPPDVPATNGLAQIVNNVLLPRFVFQNLFQGLALENVQNGGEFSTLLRLVTAAGLESTLATVTGVTLLAPNNDGIPTQTEQFLLRPGNEDILNDVLTYHLIAELFNYAAQPIPNVQLVESLQGENIVAGLVLLPEGGVLTRYNQANQLSHVVVRQSIIYTIDLILVPPSLLDVVPRGPITNATASNGVASIGDKS